MTTLETLKKYFGYASFREGQERIVNTILSGRDALAIMPTGAGKSICYQLPAYINSSLTEPQISKALNYAAQGVYKIVYVAPERLETWEFRQFAARAEISMVTVDEAHCISQWGQDFRPSYLKIVDFVNGLETRPILSAFTATATEEVKEDIACVLGLRNPELVVTGFDRENLYYRVENIRKKDDFLLEYVEKHS